LDIINIGFVNVFPDSPEALEDYPGSNFGNQCGASVYTVNGEPTKLYSDCHQIVEDIPLCQTAGKKVFLSFGGGYPADGQFIASDTSGEEFADFIWGAFGPPTDAWTNAGKPRPFGDIIFDGFDFDIEYNGPTGAYIPRLRGPRWLTMDQALRR
jgi:chitinase